MDNPQEFTQEQMQIGLDNMTCPRCKRPTDDLRNVGFSARQYREETQHCFWFNKDSFECNNG